MGREAAMPTIGLGAPVGSPIGVEDCLLTAAETAGCRIRSSVCIAIARRGMIGRVTSGDTPESEVPSLTWGTGADC